MTTRITANDARKAFKVYANTLARYPERKLVRPGFHLLLQEGSKTNGIGWRIYETSDDWMLDGGGYHEPLVGSNYLGSTAREAYDLLLDRASMVRGVLGAEVLS